MSTTLPVDTRRPSRRPTSTHSYSYVAPRGGGLSVRDTEWGTEFQGNVHANGLTVEVWAQQGGADKAFAQFCIQRAGRVHVFNECGANRSPRGLVLRAHALAKKFARGEW